jgi:hypothetical protein
MNPAVSLTGSVVSPRSCFRSAVHFLTLRTPDSQSDTPQRETVGQPGTMRARAYRSILDGVRAEGVALIPECAECERPWLPADEKRWRAYLTDDEPPEVAFFCPDCAEQKFGA